MYLPNNLLYPNYVLQYLPFCLNANNVICLSASLHAQQGLDRITNYIIILLNVCKGEKIKLRVRQEIVYMYIVLSLLHY